MNDPAGTWRSAADAGVKDTAAAGAAAQGGGREHGTGSGSVAAAAAVVNGPGTGPAAPAQYQRETSDGGDDCLLPKAVKRPPEHRVFVNRSLHLEKIKFFGFDMDYTLAVYKSPEYEALLFGMVQTRLVDMGYPAGILDFRYDASFPIRGLWFDNRHGTLLKVDAYGNILTCVRGFRFLKLQEVRSMYPNKFLQLDESRVHVLNTLFDVPVTYIIACVVEYFSARCPEAVPTPTGVKLSGCFMSYHSIFRDIRAAVDAVHVNSLKQRTVAELDKYVERDPRLALLLARLKAAGKVLFLLTNSDFAYTNRIMTHILDGDEGWAARYFDYVVCDANKPTFFGEGTLLRLVDPVTRVLKLGVPLDLPGRGGGVQTGGGHHQQQQQRAAPPPPHPRGHSGSRSVPPPTGSKLWLCSGGSCDVLTSLMGAKGKDVLYVGDHIYGDILKSKKLRGWRTFLVVPELTQELLVWTQRGELFTKLQVIDAKMSDVYKDMDSSVFFGSGGPGPDHAAVAVADGVGTTAEPPLPASSNPDPDPVLKLGLARKRAEMNELRAARRDLTHDMELSYGILGSLFRSGSRPTFFASQVMRYADLYAAAFVNLLHYPFFYVFNAPSVLMGHESTVTHSQFMRPDVPSISRSRTMFNVYGDDDHDHDSGQQGRGRGRDADLRRSATVGAGGGGGGGGGGHMHGHHEDSEVDPEHDQDQDQEQERDLGHEHVAEADDVVAVVSGRVPETWRSGQPTNPGPGHGHGSDRVRVPAAAQPEPALSLSLVASSVSTAAAPLARAVSVPAVPDVPREVTHLHDDDDGDDESDDAPSDRSFHGGVEEEEEEQLLPARVMKTTTRTRTPRPEDGEGPPPAGTR